MSLVMAVRCGDSAVVMADSQETYGDGSKSVVEKIVPMTSATFEVGFTAAGNCAGLIDTFADELADKLSHSAASTEAEIRAEISGALARFHLSTTFDAYPVDKADKLIVGIVCVRLKTERKVLLWRFEATALSTIDTYYLTGFEHPVYSSIARRLYGANLTQLQGVIVCLHVFSVAKKTSTVIGPPIKCLIGSPSEMTMEDQGRVDELEHLVDQTATAVDVLLLAAPDSTNPTVIFRSQLNHLHVNLFKMRTESMRLATRRAIRAAIQKQDDKTVGQLLPRGAPLFFRIGLDPDGGPAGAPRGMAGTEVVHVPDLYHCLSHDRYLATMWLQDFVNAILQSREINVDWHLSLMDSTTQLFRACRSMEIAAQNIDREYASAGKVNDAINGFVGNFTRAMESGQDVLRKISAGIAPLNHAALTELVRHLEDTFTDMTPEGFADRLMHIPVKWK